MRVRFSARYIKIDEGSLYDAMSPANEPAVLDIEAENHLLGLQLAGDVRYPVLRRGVGRASFLLEAGAFYQVQVLPRVSMRVGYEFWCLRGLALAPEQTDFLPGADEGRDADVEGDLYFHGLAAGMEVTW